MTGKRKTYRVYVRDVFCGEAAGADEKNALSNFVSELGFDGVNEYARECFCRISEIELRLKGSVLW